MKEYREANSLLRKGLVVSPGNINFLELLSITAVRLNLLDEALELFYELKTLYEEREEWEKFDLVVKNIDIIQIRIQESTFPEEMPALPNESNEINNSEALEALETIIEDNINNFKYHKSKKKKSLARKQEEKIIENLSNSNEKEEKSIEFAIKKADLKIDNVSCRFENISDELIDFYNEQERDDSKIQGKLEFRKMTMEFFEKAKKIVEGDYRSSLDLAIACQTMGFYDMAMQFYRAAIEINPEKEKELQELISRCEKELGKTSKLAA